MTRPWRHVEGVPRHLVRPLDQIRCGEGEGGEGTWVTYEVAGVNLWSSLSSSLSSLLFQVFYIYVYISGEIIFHRNKLYAFLSPFLSLFSFPSLSFLPPFLPPLRSSISLSSAPLFYLLYFTRMEGDFWHNMKPKPANTTVGDKVSKEGSSFISKTHTKVRVYITLITDR